MNINKIIVNNRMMSYFKINNAGEKCLLFLHGWRSNKEIWSRVVSKIKDKGLRIYALDLPGFGGSPAPKITPPLIPPPRGEGKDGGWTVADYAKVVKGFIEKLELKNVILVGHSFGGRVGIKLAADPHSASGHPLPKGEGRVRGLVLVDSAGFAMPSKKKILMQTAAKIVKPFFKPKFMQPLRKKIYQTIGAEDYLATPALQETFKNIISEDLTEDMKRIKVPTLIVWGEEDQETPLAFGRRMKFEIRNSKFEILPNAGHFSFLDQPEEFVKVLNDFVAR